MSLLPHKLADSCAPAFSACAHDRSIFEFMDLEIFSKEGMTFQAMRFASIMSALLDSAILHVLLVGPKPEMIGIEAGGSIAGMHNQSLIVIRKAKMKHCGEAMNSKVLSANGHHSIASGVLASCPKPASCNFVNLSVIEYFHIPKVNMFTERKGC